MNKQPLSRLILPLLFLLGACSSITKIKKPFYYEVKHQEKTYHFLGTMHEGFRLDSLPENIKKDLKKADIVRVEATLGMQERIAAVDQDRLEKVFQNMDQHYPLLKNRLRPQTWKYLSYTLNHDDVKKYVKELNITHSSLEVHPSLVFVITRHFVDTRTNVFHPDLLESYSRYKMLKDMESKSSRIDQEIEKFAKENGIQVQSLDTPELVQTLFNELYKNQDIDYIEGVYGGGEQNHAVQDIRAAFISGDEKKMASFIEQSKEIERILLIRRNEHWFNALIEEGNKNIFVAVGALHLVGDNSLLTYFRNRGMKVVRVD